MHNLSAVRSFPHYPVVNVPTEIVGSNRVRGHEHYWNNNLRNSYAQSESITGTTPHDRDRLIQRARFSRAVRTSDRNSTAEESRSGGAARTPPNIPTHLHGPARAHGALCGLSQVSESRRIPRSPNDSQRSHVTQNGSKIYSS
jgi:hypothetical protein